VPTNPVSQFATEALSAEQVLLGLILALALSLVLRWHYLRFSSVFANRDHLANIPLIAATTLLVITVVKSSLALSLGLVGAMSIVRFRTPIKEPEELGYLFLAIGIGLGAGAGQLLITAMATLAILAFMWTLKHYSSPRAADDYDLFVEIDGAIDNQHGVTDRILKSIADQAASLNLAKLEQSDSGLMIGATISLRNHADINDLISTIRSLSPTARCTFIDHKAVSL
jgi:Domain of unknown function (DUF4956)